jgi:hypothetical protein
MIGCGQAEKTAFDLTRALTHAMRAVSSGDFQRRLRSVLTRRGAKPDTSALAADTMGTVFIRHGLFLINAA